MSVWMRWIVQPYAFFSRTCLHVVSACPGPDGPSWVTSEPAWSLTLYRRWFLLWRPESQQCFVPLGWIVLHKSKRVYCKPGSNQDLGRALVTLSMLDASSGFNLFTLITQCAASPSPRVQSEVRLLKPAIIHTPQNLEFIRIVFSVQIDLWIWCL